MIDGGDSVMDIGPYSMRGEPSCKGGMCDKPLACQQENECLYKSSAEERKEVLHADTERLNWLDRNRFFRPELTPVEMTIREDIDKCMELRP